MAEPIYKKVGRRYREIGVCDLEASYYPHGAHLVICEPGSQLTYYNIEPQDAAVLAAAQKLRAAMVTAMREASTPRLTRVDRRPLTAKERKGWEAYKAVAGEPNMLYLEGVSMHDVVEAAIGVVVREAKSALSSPAAEQPGATSG